MAGGTGNNAVPNESADAANAAAVVVSAVAVAATNPLQVVLLLLQ
jgi:hypothetical protein